MENNARVPGLVAALLLALTLVAVAQFKGMDPDFFWHVHTGQLYLQGARPDLADPYSWSAAGRYWLDHEWLGEELWAGVLAWAGLGGIRALQLLLVALLLGLSYVFGRREGVGPRLAAAQAMGVTVLAFPWYLPRLQVFTGLGLVGLLLLVQGLRGWWLVPASAALVALWANLHGGGAIVGAGVLTILAVVERRKVLFAAAAAGWAALLLNPAGVRLPIFSLASVLDPRLGAMNSMINEWQRWNPVHRMDQLFALWVLGLVAAGVLSQRRPQAGWAVLGLVFVGLGWSANRNFPLAAVGTLPLLSGWVASWPAWSRGRRRAGLALLAVAAVVTLLRFPAFAEGPSTGVGFAAASPAAMQALRDKARGRRLLNWYSWGGEIIFSCSPDVKVFIDGRQYVFGFDVNRDYYLMEGARPGYEKLLARYGVDAAFFPPDWPLTNVLKKRPGWHVAYEGPDAILVLRDR